MKSKAQNLISFPCRIIQLLFCNNNFKMSHFNKKCLDLYMLKHFYNQNEILGCISLYRARAPFFYACSTIFNSFYEYKRRARNLFNSPWRKLQWYNLVFIYTVCIIWCTVHISLQYKINLEPRALFVVFVLHIYRRESAMHVLLIFAAQKAAALMHHIIHISRCCGEWIAHAYIEKQRPVRDEVVQFLNCTPTSSGEQVAPHIIPKAHAARGILCMRIWSRNAQHERYALTMPSVCMQLLINRECCVFSKEFNAAEHQCEKGEIGIYDESALVDLFNAAAKTKI